MKNTDFDILVGHTGLVGSNIEKHFAFKNTVNSKGHNIEPSSLKTGIIAAGDARKWYARDNYYEFEEAQNRLFKTISNMALEKIILISTIDVLDCQGADEEHNIRRENVETNYGKIKLDFERKLKDNCELQIIRLPGLIGEGLKKNLIYDLMHNRDVAPMHPKSTFQIFDLENIGHLINKVISDQIPLIHASTEPVSVFEIAQIFGRSDFLNSSVPIFSYDMRTKYSDFSNFPYLQNKSGVIESIKSFAARGG